MSEDKPKYQEQYCKKHKQRYASFLNECPVCVGEELGKIKNPLYINEPGDLNYKTGKVNK